MGQYKQQNTSQKVIIFAKHQQCISTHHKRNTSNRNFSSFISQTTAKCSINATKKLVSPFATLLSKVFHIW